MCYFLLGPKISQAEFIPNLFYNLVINLWGKMKNKKRKKKVHAVNAKSFHLGAMILQMDIVLPNQSNSLNTTEMFVVCNGGKLEVS